MKTKILLPLMLLLAGALPAQQKDVAPLALQNSKPKTQNSTRAVVVGISDYQDPAIPDLRFAHRDAEAFANFLRSPAGGSLDGDHLKVLTNENATAGRIAAAFDALVEQLKEGDQAIIYFSGHGDVERKTISQPGFLLCWDAPSRVYMGGGTYSLTYLQEIVQTLSIQNKVRVTVITDACHAGKLAGSQMGGAQATTAALTKQFANEVKILSCQPNEFSLEGEQWGGGHGAFSYHLVDGLFGLADGNGDDRVTLMEIGRYLEDHVSSEVAPQSQVPVTTGNRGERLSKVVPELLADLQKFKSGQLPRFEPVEQRGFEDEVLAMLDSAVQKKYEAFALALKEKRFFEPEGNNAEELYAQLIAKNGLAPLHGFIKRNFAAALQDDAQQAMNIWMKADVQQLDCIGTSLRLEPIPRSLERAATLLGAGHYMYRPLLARKLLFQGILLTWKKWNPDERLARQCLSLYRQAIDLEPQLPLIWHGMSLVYMRNLRQPDSAFICAKAACNLAPNWVLPFADMSFCLMREGNMLLAKEALQAAEAIDSLHPYVLTGWADWYGKSAGRANKEKALTLYENYRSAGGPMYACWYNNYGVTLFDLDRDAAAEIAFLKSIELDSTMGSARSNLGSLYQKTGRYAEAEAAYKKAISVDSIRIQGWSNLGKLYLRTGRYMEALPLFKQTILLDSTQSSPWNSLGFLYNRIENYAESEQAYKRAVSLDSMDASLWSNLASVYLNTGQNTEAEAVLKKAVLLDSTFRNAWNNLGSLYLNTGRYAEAEPVLKKAISLDAKFANPHRHLAMLCFKTGRLEEARQGFLKGIELNPNYAGALLGMAYIGAAEGKMSDALGYVEQAIQKKATFPQLQKDEDLAPLRALPEWKALLKKYFPDEIKD